MKMGRKQLRIDMPLDVNGYFDRKCPNKECGIHFKVLFQDWKNKVKDEIVYCPICKFTAPASEWNTQAQQDYIDQSAQSHIKKEIETAIKKDVKSFNRRQIASLIPMTLSYKPGSQIIPIPPEVAEELIQNYECDKCSCRYSFLGSTYFCPACGNENIIGNIKGTIHNIENFLNKSSEIKFSFHAVFSKEETESYFNQIIEEHFCKIVSLLQRYCKYLFLNRPNSSSIEIRKNLFQNLQESSVKWKELTGKGYEDILDDNLYKNLIKYFQMRHLLAHTGGIVDDTYVNKTNDNSYMVGQRIIVKLDILETFLKHSKQFMEALEENYK